MICCGVQANNKTKMLAASIDEQGSSNPSSPTRGIDVLIECLENSPSRSTTDAATGSAATSSAAPAASHRVLPFGTQGAAAGAQGAAAGTQGAAAGKRVLPFGPHAGAQSAQRKLPCFSAPGTSLPLLSLPASVSIVYTRSCGEANECCDFLKQRLSQHASSQHASSLVGLDIEWTVTYTANMTQRPASVLQIATGGTCYVFQLSAMPRFPERLRALLEDTAVVKTGCKVGNDALKLRRDYGVRVARTLDLGKIAAKALPYGDRPWSLADLCESVLHRRMRKDVRLSNWESRLTDEQLSYAAADAWASRAVGVALLRRLEAASGAARGSASGGGACVQQTCLAHDEGVSEEERLLCACAAAGLVEDTPPDPMAERRAAPAAAGSAGGAGREEAPSRE